jgi:hypothetical protein
VKDRVIRVLRRKVHISGGQEDWDSEKDAHAVCIGQED